MLTLKRFAVTGGDPFEYADFERFLDELSVRGKEINILGIPERVTKENLEMLSKYNVTTYQVSLDGMKNTHDMIRGEGSFDKTIEALKFIENKSSIKAHIMYTINRENCDEMFDLIDYLLKEDISALFSFDFMVLEGNAKSNLNLLEKDKVDEILDRYRKIRMKLKHTNSKLVLKEKIKLFETFNINDANKKFKKYSYISGCSCGIASISILPNGNLLACRRLPVVIGNLVTEDYAELFFNNPIMRKLRRISSFKECNNCDYAKVCRGCPALAYSVTGDIFGAMPYCNKKKEIIPLLNEPAIDCSLEEERAYLTNNLAAAIEKEGVEQNMCAIKYNIYLNCLIRN